MSVAPVEHSGRTVLEFLSIPGSLGHCLPHVQSLIALALDMDTEKAHKVRHLSTALRPSRLHIVAVLLKDPGKL